MDFFEELGKTVVKFGEATAQKTKEVAEYAKINAQILENQNKLDKAYIAVGKKYMMLHPANEDAEMNAVVKNAQALEAQLKNLRKQLQDLKGTAKCKVCGTECTLDAVFCGRCGAKMMNGQAEPMEEETEIVEACEIVEEADLVDLANMEEVESVEDLIDAEDLENLAE